MNQVASKPLRSRFFCLVNQSFLMFSLVTTLFSSGSASYGKTAMPKSEVIEGVIGEDYKVSIEPRDAKTLKPTSFKVGALQAAEIKVVINNKAANPPVLKFFDITMPSHGHGMPTKATFRKTSDLNYIVEGIQLSMRGEWVAELKFEVNGTMTKELRIPFNMK